MKNTKFTLIKFLVAVSIIFLVLGLIIPAIYHKNDKFKETYNIVTSKGSQSVDFEVIKIGDCEYISKDLRSNFALLTHKGDCNNPIHQHNR